MKNLLLTMCLMIATTTAWAWSEREQGALAGAAAVVIGQHIFNSPRHYHAPPPPVYRETPVYVYPQPVVVPPSYTPIPGGYVDVCRYRNQEVRIYDAYGQVIGWRYCN